MRLIRDGVALACEEAGAGDPKMVLVHGWGLDRTVMKRQFEHARTSRRVVSVDLRGFGESDAPEQAYTIEGYSDDLAFVIGSLGLEKPIVVGHSMGGMIALDFAARHAEQVSAVALLEAMVVVPESAREALQPMLQGVRSTEYRDMAARVMTYLTGPGLDAAERARLSGVAAACRQHVLVSALEGILAFDSVAAAARVKCPLLYVGTSTPYADVDQFREICPQLVVDNLPGCGHYFPLEAPEKLNAILDGFVQRLSAV